MLCAFTSLFGVHCEPSLLHPLQVMLEKLLGEGSSAETASPGPIPQQGFAQPSLLSKASPAPAAPRGTELGPAQSPLVQTRQGLSCWQGQPEHSPAAASRKRLHFHC